MKVPLASVGLRNKDIEAAIKVLRSNYLTMGEQVQQFEEAMANYLKVKHFIMFNSGSSANLAIIEGLLRPVVSKPRLQRNDGVLVPAIAWPTTIWPLIQLGLKPCFVDISLENLAIDLKKAQELIDQSNQSIKAIFPIHPVGFGIDSKMLEEFALSNNLVLINDVCESLGSWHDDRHSGTCGLAASFSFYFSHHITTMEGGGVATNNDFFADDLRSIRSHGWSRNRHDAEKWSKNLSSSDAKFLFVSTGYNIRPMEIQAAIGLSQLSDIDDFIFKRQLNAHKVHNTIKGSEFSLIAGEFLEDIKTRSLHSWMMLPIVINRESKKLRSEVQKFLDDRGIESRPVLTGNFLKQPSMERISKGDYLSGKIENANFITDNAFMIGNHHDFSEEQISLIISALDTLSSK